MANYDEFDTAAAGGGTRTYWRGLEKIVPGGKDDMLGNPDGLGGNRTRPLPGKVQKDSFKKKSKKPSYSMKKIAIKFSAGTIAGPKATMKGMSKVTSGFPMAKIFKASKTKPITGSVQMMPKTAGDKTMHSTMMSGFRDEIEKNAGVGSAIKGIAKGIYGAGKAGISKATGAQAKSTAAFGPKISLYGKGKMGAKEFAKKLTKGQAATAAGAAGIAGGAAAT